MLTQFHEKAQKAIVIAESIAFDLGHSSVGSEHLLLSFLKIKDCSFSKILKNYRVDDEIIYKDIVRLFGEKDIQPFYMEYSEVVKKILDDAMTMSEARKDSKVSLNTVCIALLLQKESVAVELLNKYHVPFDEVKKELSEEKSLIQELNLIHELTNMNELVKKQERVMIGRDRELQQLLQTLCKKEKNNALLIGKAGVGKTALVEKLALKINQQDVPRILRNKTIFELSLSSIVAGTKYRGEFEEKFKKIIQKVIQAKDAILFIDEIHNLIGAGGAEGAIDASNILKPYLARRDLTIIGATTIDEYYKYFEKDQAMNRRFAIIKLNENTKEETKEILLGLKKQYQDYHQIQIKRECIDYIIDLCEHYLPQRVFPDKAIDVLDLSCVKTSFLNESSMKKVHIEKVIEEITGLTIHKKVSYQELKTHLNEHIFGQEEAIHTIVHSIQSLTAYPHPTQPQGVYLLLGSSGVGKTETAKIIAKLMNRNFIKLDMSEYSDPTSVNKIIGSSPGYVGYDDHSSLLHEIILHPNSILLLDEIEKAHPQVMHLFLQVFDEGYLKDNHQHFITFKDTIIIMTSNVVHQNNISVGFKKQTFSKESLKEFFSEEFLNRINEIISYKTLTQKDYEEILVKNAPIPLTKEMIIDILEGYDFSLGARPLLVKMRKYIVSHSL
ncbi:MAG: ATP-dependent Clp protease ATP-binding subunit [Coprobacillus sp.]|nr:ATP-dependent Clp protease ATP-binding subunit [Coprobacillus sp.]